MSERNSTCSSVRSRRTGGCTRHRSGSCGRLRGGTCVRAFALRPPGGSWGVCLERMTSEEPTGSSWNTTTSLRTSNGSPSGIRRTCSWRSCPPIRERTRAPGDRVPEDVDWRVPVVTENGFQAEDAYREWQEHRALRVEKNEQAFRAYNERRSEFEREALERGDAAPFVCECGDAGCHQALNLTVEEFEASHERPDFYAVRP